MPNIPVIPIIIIILAVLIIVLLASNLKVVQQSRAYVIERMGAFHTVWGEWPVFTLGILFGHLLGRRRAVIPAGLCLAVGVFCAAAGLPSYHSLSLLAGAVFWALFWLGQAALPAVTRVLALLARDCYGVFLIHHVFITLVLLRFVRALGGGFLVWAAFWVVCVAGSFVLAGLVRRIAAPLTKALRPKAAPVT